MNWMRNPFSRLGEPWRKVSSFDKDAYLDDITKFSPDQKEVKHIRVMLYGPTGARKSSFINTMESSVRRRITSQSLPDAIGHDSFTRKFTTHRIKKGPGAYFPFVFTDLMGLEKRGGVRLDDITLAMQGHVKEGYQFNPTTSLSTDDKFYNISPTLDDKTHVLVCVVPANTVDLLNNDFIEKIRDVRLSARDLGIPQMAILTKIDEACPKVKSNLKNVYESKIIGDKVSKLSASLGIPPNFIFPVKNYYSEIELDDFTDVLTLMALKQILNFRQDFVDGHF